MGRPSAKQRKPYDLDGIIDVAVRVFLERGYDGSSLEDIARAAKITKSSIYYHVASKEELLSRGGGRAFDALLAVFDERNATDGTACDRLRHVLRRTVEITVEKLPEVALLLRVRGNTPAEKSVVERRRSFDHMIADIVIAAIREGSIRSDVDPRLTTRLLFGMLNSIAEWYRPDGALSAADIAETVFKIIFDGLTSKAKDA
ncbi:MAG TPA: TetR/AcrR family transcriptional regulator [Candidatus Binataceae bacterium]|jgi:AcrR family transcriptional regulator